MRVFRVVITGIVLAQRCQNVLHFIDNSDSKTEDNVKDEINANFRNQLTNLQNFNMNYSDMSVQIIHPAIQPMVLYPLTGQHGALSGAPAPPVLCALFSIRTATAGRHGHGRFYMFGVHGESVLNGIVEPGAYSAYQTAAANLTNRFKSGGTGPIQLAVVPRNNPSAAKPCTAIVVRQQFGIQRRRNIGVGG